MFAELSNYLDERLDDSMCEELEKHLDGCEPCQAFVSSLEATIESFRQMPSPDPDPIRASRLRTELLSQYKRASDGGFRKGSLARAT
jgi:anti-sigma factor RsiW